MLTQDDLLRKQIEKELENLEFKALEKEYIFEGIFIPKSWWIEKNLVGQERLKKYMVFMLWEWSMIFQKKN